jgi:purine-binding chemotaxis protein CheW
MQTATLSQQLNQQNEDRLCQLVTFRLAGEYYGVPIMQVREIILPGTITRIPRSPVHVRGVINLRKKVIPVIDLRVVFGLEEIEIRETTRILILEIADHLVGVLVDAVSEVLRLPHEAIGPPPPFAGRSAKFLTGLAEVAGKLLMVIDMGSIISEEEIDPWTETDGAADWHSEPTELRGALSVGHILPAAAPSPM